MRRRKGKDAKQGVPGLALNLVASKRGEEGQRCGGRTGGEAGAGLGR